jgi:sugar phosphate isomerase/epimerase
MAYRRDVRTDQIALQLYTVRRPLAADPSGTLAAVAEAGFRNVEIAGVPAAMRAAFPGQLRAAGLRAVAAHVGLDELRADPSAVGRWLTSLACSRLVVPSLPDDERPTVDGLRRVVAELNGQAERLAADGIRVAYHNHASEFEPLDGTTAWDVLLAELDPSVDLEIDVYWASVGGRDPATLIEEAGSRVRLLHLKDRQPGEPPRDAPAGEGIVDLGTVVRAGEAVGVEWYIAEQDEPADPFADIATARRNLARLAAAT